MIALPLIPPYDWPAMIAFFAARAIAGVEDVQPGCYCRSVTVGVVSGVISVRPQANGDALVLQTTLPRAVRAGAVWRIRRMFDLDGDPNAVADALRGDPLLAPLVAARPGLRVPGAWDGFELAARAVLGQQITVAAARGLAARLVQACGTVLPVPSGAVTHLFPSPGAVAGAPDLGLVLGMPRQRAQTLAALAGAVAADPDMLAPVGTLEECLARLGRLSGIGPWTANYIALRWMRQMDAFPAADIGLLRAAATELGRPDPAALLRRAEAWRPFRAYAAQHLWTRDALTTPAGPRARSGSPAQGRRRAARPGN